MCCQPKKDCAIEDTKQLSLGLTNTIL